MRSPEDYMNAAAAAVSGGSIETALELIRECRDMTLVKFWCTAEKLCFDALSDAERTRIRQRLYDRTATTAGDLAVAAVSLLQQLDELDTEPRAWLAEAAQRSVTDVRYVHWYDSTARPTNTLPWAERLFTNAHIGNLSQTNLQIAGQLSVDVPVFLTKWYLTTSISDAHVDGCVELAIDHRRVADGPMHWLLNRPRRLHQWVNAHEMVDGLIHLDTNPDHTRVFLHVEGWTVKSR